MSLKQTLDKSIGNIIKEYTKLIADTYNLDSEKLMELWEDSSSVGCDADDPPPPPPPPPSQPKEPEELDPVYLLKCKKPELKALCKKRGVRCTGTKAQLIGYLQGKSPSTKKSAKKSAKKNTSKNSDKKSSNIVKNIVKNIPVIAIRKNQYGNHEHPETHLVFNDKLKKVVGVQCDDGTVSKLTKADIDICNKFKFSYVTPSNLDNSKLDDEQIEELDDDEFEDEFEEEFEEELEEEDEEDEEELYEEEVYEEEVYE